MKKAIPYILSLSLLSYLVIVLFFAEKKMGEVYCKDITVNIEKEENSFIDEEEVIQLFKRSVGNLKDIPVAKIDKDSVERMLIKNSMIKSAQVYYRLDGNVYVEVKQRNPVLRVFAQKQYYVDEEGKIMPLSKKYSARVVVATGSISPTFACERLYPFVMKMREDDFWSAMIEQIVVSSDQEVTLIPKVGNFRIRLGELENVDQKMENLYLFLREGISLKGWNKYKEINLKYDNQIVCVKK